MNKQIQRKLATVLKGSVLAGEYQLVLNGGIGFTYDVQTSTNLVDWTSLTNLVTTNVTTLVPSPDAANWQQKYFRALRQ